MKIAFLGSRGIPARYSGFETFYEELATRLAARGHAVTVYNRAHFIHDVRGTYRGVRLCALPSIPTKHLDTISHTLLSSLHALGQGYDIAYYCIVGNSPLAWFPRLTGARTLLNVDGQDWARAKWGAFARWYQRRCERLAGRTANVIIADARIIKQRYAETYGLPSVFVPYGGTIRRDERDDALRRWNLRPLEYVLFAGRLVPENGAEMVIRAFLKIATDKRLVILGDAPYVDEYKRHLKAIASDRVIFTGYAFGNDYAQLSSHAYLFVLPAAIDGTRPVLLDQLGFGNAALVRNSPANMEVIGDAGFSFDRSDPEHDLVRQLQRLIAAPDLVDGMRHRAPDRIRDFYNWEWIADYYEDLFRRVCGKTQVIDYDVFIKQPKFFLPGQEKCHPAAG